MTLLGQAVDPDGFPRYGTFTTEWTVAVGDEGNVTFDDATNPETFVWFSAAGVYVLRLTADDGDLPTTNLVIVTVNN